MAGGQHSESSIFDNKVPYTHNLFSLDKLNSSERRKKVKNKWKY